MLKEDIYHGRIPVKQNPEGFERFFPMKKGRINKGFGERLAQAIILAGYKRKNGEPDITRFALDHHHDPRKVRTWVEGTIPRGDILVDLADWVLRDERWLVKGTARLNMLVALSKANEGEKGRGK